MLKNQHIFFGKVCYNKSVKNNTLEKRGVLQ